MNRYIIYHENGRVQKLESKTPLKLEVLQKIIGGHIELVRQLLISADAPPREMLFVVDEEGLLKNRVPNPKFPCFVGTVIMTSPECVP